MKKLSLVGLVVFAFFATANLLAAPDLSKPNMKAEEEKVCEKDDNGVWHAIMLYIPNRLIDATDIITFALSAGNHAAIELHATRFLQFGGWHGPDNAYITKGYARQYGGGCKHGTETGIFWWTYNETDNYNVFGTVRDYKIDRPEFDIADFRLPAYENNDADFWEIGGELALFLGGSLNLHPVEIADFVTGIFFYDLMDDDL